MARGSYAKGIAKREEILTTALGVVAEHGYTRASLREIADAVGLSQAGVLHYFTSKDELFAQVLAKRDEVDAEPFLPLDAPVGIEAVVDVVRHNAQVPGLVQLFARLSAESTDPDSGAHDYFARRHRMFVEATGEVIARQQHDGELRDDLGAPELSRLLMAVVDGLQTQWLMDPDVDMAAHVEAFLALLRPVR